jgi:hypothetical protein
MLTDNVNRDAVTKAAAVYDEIENRMHDLQRRLDESIAHQKAGEQLVVELRLELAELRTACSTYRSDAEQARADQVAVMGCLANVEALVKSFELPSERLPMRRKRNNGKPPEPPIESPALPPSPELAGLAASIADIPEPPPEMLAEPPPAKAKS